MLDSAGREVARAESPFSLAAGQKLELEQRLRGRHAAALVVGQPVPVRAPLGGRWTAAAPPT